VPVPHTTTPPTTSTPERRYVRLEVAAARLDCNPKTLRRRIAADIDAMMRPIPGDTGGTDG